MKQYIDERIKELEKEKKDYYELLETSKIFSEKYLLQRIRSCRDRIEELEALKEYYNDRTIH